MLLHIGWHKQRRELCKWDKEALFVREKTSEIKRCPHFFWVLSSNFPGLLHPHSLLMHRDLLECILFLPLPSLPCQLWVFFMALSFPPQPWFWCGLQAHCIWFLSLSWAAQRVRGYVSECYGAPCSVAPKSPQLSCVCVHIMDKNFHSAEKVFIVTPIIFPVKPTHNQKKQRSKDSAVNLENSLGASQKFKYRATIWTNNSLKYITRRLKIYVHRNTCTQMLLIALIYIMLKYGNLT